MFATAYVGVACSRCDGNVGDGAVDASADAQQDSRAVADREMADTSSLTSDWPGWSRVKDLRGFDCPLDVATDPSKVVPSIKWIPCTDGRANCEEIDGVPFSPEIIKFPNGWFSADGRAFLISHWVKGDVVAQTDVFDTKSLTPLAAWRIDFANAPRVYCDVHVEFSETRVGALYSTSLDGGDIGRSFDVDSPQGLMASPSLTPLSVAGDGSPAFKLSDGTFAFNLGFAAALVRGATKSAATVRTKWLYELVPPLVVVGNDVFASNQHGTGDGWYREARVDSDASVSIFREGNQRHITAMVSDGTDWYWAESFGSGNPNNTVQPSVEIYTSPYTTSPATLDAAKKKLATLAPGMPSEAITSPNHYIVQIIHGQTELFRASDGHHTSVVNQGVGWCWTPLYANDQEFWCIERNGENGANGVRVTKRHLSTW